MSDSGKYTFLIISLAALFFLPFLGGVHLFDWDEVNFAEISREMMVLGDYLRVHVDYQPFFEKPPLFFWLQSATMHAFGVNEFAARLPNALCGIVTLVLLFQIGKKLFSARFGLIWAGACLGSVLPHLYFKSGIIDPWFNLFTFLGLYGFILSIWKKDGESSVCLTRSEWRHFFLGGLSLGAAVLTKGPVAYLVVGLCLAVYWAKQRFGAFVPLPQLLLYGGAALLLPLAWFGAEALSNGPAFTVEFLRYQLRLLLTPDAGHQGFPGYHVVVLLVGCFPASIFAIRTFFRKTPSPHIIQSDFTTWMSILFWVVLILFTLVRTKIVHYSSLCYFPLTFLAALTVDEIVARRSRLLKWERMGLLTIGGLFGLVTLAAPFAGMYIDRLKLFVKDPFAAANMGAAVHWSMWDLVPGLLLLACLMLFFYWLRQNQREKSFMALFLGMALFVSATLIFFIAKIEAYSQRAAVGFCETLAGEDVYVRCVGYKSYVPLFYTKKMPGGNSQSYDQNWLLTGPIDRDAWFITKIQKADRLRQLGTLEEMGEKNGFVFFRRRK
ncbi:MAG: glycosyltransferase family 39 protein [Saprospiraceae bacterium]|nr:MAG: glycosyltransferase family 39 protein [Saprospiraceae bacterium]